MEQRSRPRPAWLDLPPDQWPDAARRFWNLMATSAERELQEKRNIHNDKP